MASALTPADASSRPSTVAIASTIGKIEKSVFQAIRMAWLGPLSAMNLRTTRPGRVLVARSPQPRARPTAFIQSSYHVFQAWRFDKVGVHLSTVEVSGPAATAAPRH